MMHYFKENIDFCKSEPILHFYTFKEIEIKTNWFLKRLKAPEYSQQRLR